MVSVAMSQMVGRREERRVGERDSRKEGVKKGKERRTQYFGENDRDVALCFKLYSTNFECAVAKLLSC